MHPALFKFWPVACFGGLLWLAAAQAAEKSAAETSQDATAKKDKPAGRGPKAANSGFKSSFKATGKGAESTQEFEKDPFLELSDPRTYRLNVVVRVSSPAESDSHNVVVVAPIPMDWPEQQVRLLGEKVSEVGKIDYQVKPGQCKTFRFTIPTIEAGDSASVELLYEITRSRMEFVAPPEELALPRGLPVEVRDQFAGPAPGLEMKHPKIVNLARDLEQQHHDEGAWETVKGFWGWTRDNVDFKNGDFRGALFAIEQGCGDCEEMSALFVSMCRLSKVTARSVWVEGHNYPEFYLVDKQGQGHWIPAQVVGPEWFGEMTEYRPIFQKGDRFLDPFHRKYVRYTPQTVKADGKVEPKLTVEHQIIADSDINGPTYKNSK
jgi:transglutaminase-like putative cysteine protease